MTVAEIKTLETIDEHRWVVQEAMDKIVQLLNRRSLDHDTSKYKDDEFEGFTHFNSLDPTLQYGSKEYETAREKIRPFTDAAIALHYSRNSHHPEYYENLADMPLLDIMEMVCDWYAASKTYTHNVEGGEVQHFRNSLDVGKRKYEFTDAQLWVIDQTAKLICKLPTDADKEKEPF